MRVYLSGAIEYAPDRGRTWRDAITPWLESQQCSVYDPARDTRKDLTLEEAEHFRAWKTADLPRFQSVVRKIIRYDLDKIERESDLVLCYWDEHAQRGAGTQAEVSFAHRLGKAVYLVSPLPTAQISGWILGCSDQVFQDFAGFKRHIHMQMQRAATTAAGER